MRVAKTVAIIAAAAVMSMPFAVEAKNKHGGQHCPPGLAKKNPPCVPPGLAKKGDWVGDFPNIFLDPDRYDLDGRYGWYQLGENLYVRTDRETGEILRGRVPAGSVVVPGSLPAADGSRSLFCAVIVKRVDERTRSRTSVNELLRNV